MQLDDFQKIHFRDELRDARAAALRDAEAFDCILFAIERLGSCLLKKIEALGDYKSVLNAIAEDSALALLPTHLHGWNTPFNRLLEQLVDARNDALHQGAFARHLTTHAVQVSLILEDALMDGKDKVADFMVKNVITASLWQPLSFVRQQMLVNSFSFLPILDDAGQPTGQLVADCALACYLRKSRKERLAHTLRDAADSGELPLLTTTLCCSTDKVRNVLDDPNVKDQRLPVLVVDKQGDRKNLIGMVTGFDLL
jgi:hypothetical protein